MYSIHPQNPIKAPNVGSEKNARHAETLLKRNRSSKYVTRKDLHRYTHITALSYIEINDFIQNPKLNYRVLNP